jgi:predicted phage terminase large subunit-like protein
VGAEARRVNVRVSAAELASMQSAMAQLEIEDLEMLAWRLRWLSTARDKQRLPEGDWWTTWFVCAGRGYGKTLLGAQALGWYAATNPNSRCAVVAPTLNDVRAVCIEGQSGLMSILPEAIVETYNKSLLEIHLKNGSIIRGFGGDAYDRLRGPQHHMAWLDEISSWQYPEEAYSMLKFGLRLGEHPKVIVTSTPKPIDLVRKLIEEGEDEHSSTVVTTGSTFENEDNLAKTFIDEMSQMEGTQLARQELYAEIISELEGGIVSQSWFKIWPAARALPQFDYVVQSYDCATSDKTVNDPTACVVLGIFRPSPDRPMAAMVIDAWSDHMKYPDLRPRVIEEATSIYGDDNEFGNGKKVDLILIEDKSAGISLIQDLQRAGLNVRAYNPGRADKTTRLNLVAPLIARGRVYLPESEERPGMHRKWLDPMVTQVCSFPNSRHDDYCDALSQALRVLRDMGFLNIDPIPDDDDYYPEDRSQRQNPYAM